MREVLSEVVASINARVLLTILLCTMALIVLAIVRSL
jgi:hypothetical protein